MPEPPENPLKPLFDLVSTLMDIQKAIIKAVFTQLKILMPPLAKILKDPE